MKLHRSSEFLNEIFEPKKIEGREAIRKQKIEEITKDFRPFLEKSLDQLGLGELINLNNYSDDDYQGVFCRSWEVNYHKIGKTEAELWYKMTIEDKPTKNIQLYRVKVDLYIGKSNVNTQFLVLGHVFFDKSTGDLYKIKTY